MLRRCRKDEVLKVEVLPNSLIFPRRRRHLKIQNSKFERYEEGYMEDDYTGGDICIDGSTDCIGNDIVYGSRTDIHLKKKPRPSGRGFDFV